jgi:hypothetical protein
MRTRVVPRPRIGSAFGRRRFRPIASEVWGNLDIPHIAGVYVIHFEGELTFVGRSVDLARRISEHARGSQFGFRSVMKIEYYEIP